MTEQTAPTNTADEMPHLHPWPKGKLEPSIVLPLVTTYLFLAGWLFNQGYYGFFGLDHKTLGLPFQIYLISPWFVYVAAALSLPMYLATMDLSASIGEWSGSRVAKQPSSPPAKWRRFLPSGETVFVWTYGGATVFGCWWQTLNLLVLFGGSLNESLIEGALLFLYAVILPGFDKDEWKGAFKRIRRLNALLYLYFALWILNQASDAGVARAAAHSLSADKRIPQVAIVWNDGGAPEGKPDPISRDAYDLRLLWSSSSELYVFSPRLNPTGRVPKVFCVPRDKVRYYVQRQ